MAKNNESKIKKIFSGIIGNQQRTIRQTDEDIPKRDIDDMDSKKRIDEEKALRREEMAERFTECYNLYCALEQSKYNNIQYYEAFMNDTGIFRCIQKLLEFYYYESDAVNETNLSNRTAYVENIIEQIRDSFEKISKGFLTEFISEEQYAFNLSIGHIEKKSIEALDNLERFLNNITKQIEYEIEKAHEDPSGKYFITLYNALKMYDFESIIYSRFKSCNVEEFGESLKYICQNILNCFKKSGVEFLKYENADDKSKSTMFSTISKSQRFPAVLNSGDGSLILNGIANRK